MGTATGLAKSFSSALSRRYRDAYSVAAGLVRFGNAVKRCSIILAGVVMIGAVHFRQDSWGYINWLFLLSGLLVAGITGAIGFMSGTFIAAQGQFMSAMLDTAVNTSPHLQDSEKASIMTL